MKLSKHQQRVLAALWALESAHGWRWWPRVAIGEVVDAGGFHQTIQLTTISILKERGLVQTERSDWPDEVRALVRCSCGRFTWGLTDAGRDLAQSMRITSAREVEERVERCRVYAINFNERDEDDRPWLNGDDDDDDDRGPTSPAPVPAGDLCHA